MRVSYVTYVVFFRINLVLHINCHLIYILRNFSKVILHVKTFR